MKNPCLAAHTAPRHATSITIFLTMVLMLPGLLLVTPANATAQKTGSDWTEKKCTLYQQFRDQTQAPLKQDDLGAEFLQNEAAFVASGCTARSYVCPISAAELKYANTMSLLMMNAGATGSFLPYACN